MNEVSPDGSTQSSPEGDPVGGSSAGSSDDDTYDKFNENFKDLDSIKFPVSKEDVYESITGNRNTNPNLHPDDKLIIEKLYDSIHAL
jgi:hypothetical protein